MKRLFIWTCIVFCSVSVAWAEQPAIANIDEAKTYSQKVYNLFKAGDYNEYAAVLPAGLLKVVNEKNYADAKAQIAARLGNIGDMIFVTRLRLPGDMTVLLWKLEYDSGKGEKLDCLVQTTFSIKEGKWEMVGFRFL